jgi:hypothetical protein
MNERPKFFCKFRNWKPSIEKNSETGAFSEHHRTKEMFLDANFYCQPPHFFDDPHDGLLGARPTGGDRDIDNFLIHYCTTIPEIIRKNKFTSPTQLSRISSQNEKSEMARLARKRGRRNVCVLSLTGDCGDELMWSFYADSHRGICLCFDAQHPFFSEARIVRYINVPKTSEKPIDNNLVNDPLLYAKSRRWKWQKEWRMVWPGETPRFVPFPREALKAVVLGEWFQQAGFGGLKQTLIHGGYHVHLFKMDRLPDSFNYAVTPLGEIKPQ